MHEKPVRPFLDHEILGKRVSQHVAVGDHMHDVGAAILLPQRDVGGADVEKENVLVLGRVGELQQRGGGGVDHEIAMPAVIELLHRLDRIFGRGDGADIETVEIAKETAAGIVLLDRHLGSGNARVLWLDIETRRGERMLDHLADVADRHRAQRRRLLHRHHEAAFAFFAKTGLLLVGGKGERTRR